PSALAKVSPPRPGGQRAPSRARGRRKYPPELREGQAPMRSTPVEIGSEPPVVRGERYGDESERWAVLVHEEGRDLDAWRVLVRPLVGLGICVLAIDIPGHGASDDPWEPRRLPEQVLAALRLAESEGARTLCLIGAGEGA